MPLLTINRKDTGGKSIGRNSPVAANPASKRFQYGGIVADRRMGSRNRGHIAS
jgi:hypothetical protein